jgi:putative ABC transport system permease protein
MTRSFDPARRALAHGSRALLRRPLATAASALCLGLGIAACATTWSLITAAILRPFGLPDATRLVVAWETDPARGNPLIEVSLLNFLDWQHESRTLESMAVFGSSHWPTLARFGDETVPIAARGVSVSFFSTLGVRPALGRDFIAADARPDQVAPIILSDRVWRSRFGSDPTVVGRTLFVDGSDARIVGVMPRGFGFPDDPDAWISAERVLEQSFRDMPLATQRQVGVLEVVGRRRESVDNDDVRAELSRIVGELRRRHQSADTTVVAEVRPLPDVLLGAIGSRLWLALALAAVVLLFACANVAAVRLAHARERVMELATRRALGASQRRLAAELGVEAAVLTLLALPIALGGAILLIDAIATSTTVTDSGLPLGANRAAIVVTVSGLAAVAWVLSGLLPAVVTARRTGLVAGETPTRVARGVARVGAPLLVGEAAIAIAAVAIAVTALQAFDRLSRTDVGFATRGVTLIDISVPGWKYESGADVRRLVDGLQSALRGLPSVERVAAVSIRPFRFGEVGDGLPVRRAGEALTQPDDAIGASRVVVTPDYFEAIGQRFVAGRGFTAFDRDDSEAVVIISRTLARTLWGDTPAVGQRLETYSLREKWRPRLVVGVVGDAQYRGLERPSMEVYIPDTQSTAPLGSLVVSSANAAALTAPQLRNALQRVEPDIALERVQTTDELMRTVLSPARLLATLMSVLGGAGLVLLALGIFGAVATALRAAWPEIAVRQAIGARPIQAAGAPLKTLTRSLAIGVAVGLALTPLILSGASALGLGSSGMPAVPFVVAGVAVVIASLAATAPSLLRASRTSPAELLRQR